MSDLDYLRSLVAERMLEPWDSDESIDEAVVWSRAPGVLVSAIQSRVAVPLRTLELLTLAVAKRALACWELYCDDREPLEAVAAVEAAIRDGGPMPPSEMEVAAEPAFRGKPIADCRQCDTSCASEAAARLVAFFRRRDPIDAVYCLSAADMAFDQSPVAPVAEFRTWLMDVALPAAVEGRLLSEAEEAALQSYSIVNIRKVRETRT